MSKILTKIMEKKNKMINQYSNNVEKLNMINDVKQHNRYFKKYTDENTLLKFSSLKMDFDEIIKDEDIEALEEFYYFIDIIRPSSEKIEKLFNDVNTQAINEWNIELNITIINKLTNRHIQTRTEMGKVLLMIGCYKNGTFMF